MTLLDEVDSIVMLEFVKIALAYCSWGDSIVSFMPGMLGLTLFGPQCVSWRHKTWQASSQQIFAMMSLLAEEKPSTLIEITLRAECLMLFSDIVLIFIYF